MKSAWAVTSPRIIVPGATYAVTQRCAFRKLFLTPLDRLIEHGATYILASAQEKTAVELHHVCNMPNHGHTLLTLIEANLPLFCRIFFGELSKFLKVALAELGFEPPENIFRNDRPTITRQITAQSLLNQLHYQDMNPVKAGLVARVEQYPGFASDLSLMKGRSIVVTRPDIYFDPGNNPAELELKFTLPPLLRRAFGDADKVIYHLQKARRQAESELAALRTRPVLGAEALKKQHPWSEPRSPRRLTQGVRPTFRAAGDPALAIDCARQVHQFRKDHEEARRTRLAGEPAVFPYGTYAMRVLHNAPIEEAPPIGGLGVDAPGLIDCDPSKQLALPLGVDDRQLLTAALYAASASAIEEFDPDDTLAARLEDSRSDEVQRTSGPQQLTPESPKRLVVLRDSSELAKRRRREMRTARAAAEAANHSEGTDHPRPSSQPSPEPDPPESPDLEEDDPNPPPH